MAAVQVALIGDLVGSRRAEERSALHSRLIAALDGVNAAVQADVPLRITVGDEYQGVYGDLGAALRATLLLRLALLPEADARHGVGRGSIVVLAEDPRVEDGPAWWAAREAIETVATAEKRATLRGLRTAYVCAEDAGGPGPSAGNPPPGPRDQLLPPARPGGPSGAA